MSQEQDKKAQRARWINAHADGMLTPDQQAQFDRALAASKSLRDEVELQARISRTLKRQFEPPTADQILKRAASRQPAAKVKPDTSPAAAAGSRPARRFWTPAVKVTVIAASLAILAGGGWYGWLLMQESTGPTLQIARRPEATNRALHEVFADTIRQGFKPVWVCEDDKQFFQTTYQRFGHGLMLAATLPKSHQALGWSYGLSISPTSAYLLCTVDGKKAIVFIDKADRDSGQTLPEGSELWLHRRKIGEMVLYEVSELDTPQMLEHFYEKDPDEVPDDWKEKAPPTRPPGTDRGS